MPQQPHHGGGSPAGQTERDTAVRLARRRALRYVTLTGHGRAVVRRAARVLLAAASIAAIAAGLLVVLTPSANSAAARTQRWMTEHGVTAGLTVLPDRIAMAVLAVEDHRFYRHPGIDAIALARMARGALTGANVGGATIEVQLAKLLYTGGRHRLPEQVEQAALAVKLDQRYTKTQILLMYLNAEYFGHGFYGVTAAARGYFGTDPERLSWPQAALLAGLLKAPTYDDPFLHPDRARARRQHVLDRLRAVGAITGEQATTMGGTGLCLVTPTAVTMPAHQAIRGTAVRYHRAGCCRERTRNPHMTRRVPQ